MKYPGNTSVTFAPLSPEGPPYEGITGADGTVIVIDGKPFVYDSDLGGDGIGGYAYQDQGPPPGAWEYLWRVGDDHYVREEAQPAFMRPYPVEVGANS